ncbi:DUF167 domain-containing protein [Mucisphaera calidilacus]|uniref:UPF0235 protein Pan265_10780 n=1 Tax=Mucisphaera calidilacus TaxID=2527982 RepID=A0A518BW72_9BACT|nr:DUF167 domain-containing protein [Mucisphaera calidilacus]QDU71229.1 hypothetical protein Pan265_10780 [Mucisphaera calidilacus]
MTEMAQTDFMRTTEAGLELHLKVVPGSKRSAVIGLLGDRLKIAVSAPPEAGKANKEVVALLAAKLSVAHRDVTIIRGAAQPRKTALIAGVSEREAVSRLGLSDPTSRSAS